MNKQDWTELIYKRGPLILYFVLRLQNSIFLLNFLLFKMMQLFRCLDIDGRLQLCKQKKKKKMVKSSQEANVFFESFVGPFVFSKWSKASTGEKQSFDSEC